jgi:hypothetical protein
MVQSIGYLHETVASHGTSVSETEVNIIKPIDIGKVPALSVAHKNRETSGPSSHPGHWNARYEVVLCGASKLVRTRMALYKQ